MVVADVLAAREGIVIVKVEAVTDLKGARDIVMAESPASATMIKSPKL